MKRRPAGRLFVARQSVPPQGLRTGKMRRQPAVACWATLSFHGCHPTLSRRPPMSSLVALAGRCLREPASRRLDGEIYCALHNIRDINDLSDRYLLEARENGEVLVEHQRGAPRMDTGAAFHRGAALCRNARARGSGTIAQDPRRVCETALNARALTSAPPLRISNIFEFCRDNGVCRARRSIGPGRGRPSLARSSAASPCITIYRIAARVIVATNENRYLQRQWREWALARPVALAPRDRPDVVCLQELKAPQEKFPQAALRDAGYGAIWHGQKSWNGVAILARGEKPTETCRGLPGDPAICIAAISRRRSMACSSDASTCPTAIRHPVRSSTTSCAGSSD